jgi:SAM-dependent methyltransferase
MNPNFYRAFEDRYRGSRELIKERLRIYLDFIQPEAGAPDRASARAIDLGCGRGEWLELLGENGIPARGVDLDDGMLEACREHGLDVETAEAVASLRKLPADSVSIVSAFHLVEHIPFEALQALVAEALRVLTPGGLLILETPNPENLAVGASRFYLDPSHLRPLPPMLLGFLADHAGFARHKIVPLQEDAALLVAQNVRLIDVLDGASPDYGLVAQKADDITAMAPLDHLFARDYGLTIQELARRFDAGAAQLHAVGRERIESVEQRLHADREDGASQRTQVENWKLDIAHRLQETNVALAGVDDAVSFRARQIDATIERLAALEARLYVFNSQREELDERLGGTQVHLDVTTVRLNETSARLGETSARLDETRTDLSETQVNLDHTKADLSQSEVSLHMLERQLAHTQRQLNQTQETLANVLNSRFWRWTAPLRRLLFALKRPR